MFRDRPHLGDDGTGVNKPQIREPGVFRSRTHLGDDGKGVNKPQIREHGVSALDAMAVEMTENPAQFHDLTMPKLIAWFNLLSARLRHVRILNGDWSRLVTTGAAHTLCVRQGGVCGYLLDPPYGDAAGRDMGLYACESGTVAADVLAWCLANGDNPKHRIVLCGYEGDGNSVLTEAGWTEHEWFKNGFLTGGMGNLGGNGNGEKAHQQHRERIYASPHCLAPDEDEDACPLFPELEEVTA
ncbi:MAG: hypothetical protein A2W31_11460 [Planctomycetes bacterium RBG_16_64_10]|nr:MAG: hypothetical protein A2W31_11460 [Planctomycetes bacterium RBG_16_64_10]